MPLITICGHPLSGKTGRALELQAYLQSYIATNKSQITSIVVVNEESLRIDKKIAYTNKDSEKIARAELMSAVERLLSRSCIVICDSLNYIKGFRYQLYVVARTLGTPTASIICGSLKDEVINRNKELGVYEHSGLENLISRFEEPNSMARWDSPLFVLIPGDPSLASETNHIGASIVDAVIKKRAPPPNLSTIVKPLFEINYLHELDKSITEIEDTLIEAQKSGRIGAIVVPKSSIHVCLPSRHVSLCEFRRLKRQFMNINKTHTQLRMADVAQTFVAYLNINLQ